MTDTETPNSYKQARYKFVENVQKWVALDSQIKKVNEKMQEIRKMRHKFLGEINEYVTKNKMEKASIEINDGELTFIEKKEYPALTYSYLEECLSEIISDKKQVQYILNYTKENRKIKTTFEIKRNYAKTNAILQIENSHPKTSV